MSKGKSLHDQLDILREVENRGGPAPHEYDALFEVFDTIAKLRNGKEHDLAIQSFHHEMTSFSALDTMHGFVCLKPHGYAGDFEIIDRIYRNHRSHREEHFSWDEFFHAGDAATAVRGRKDYCVSLFQKGAQRVPSGCRILNVASGPCRDIFEFKSLPGDDVQRCRIHCVDADENAIAFARTILNSAADNVTFENRNVFRCRWASQYDLVWSAGLFDYLDDKAFIKLLKKLAEPLAPGGELVVGNFSPAVRSRSFMEFGDWFLNYRSEDQLRSLAHKAGFADDVIEIGRETTGANLFLHIRSALRTN